jgi:hypothetical protein
MPTFKPERLPEVLHGVPLSTLLGWAREPALASPEIRELLRLPEVIAALSELAALERDAGGDLPKVIA